MPQILVVDDSQVVRQEVSRFLVAEKFDVITAEDGLKGLEAIRNHPELKLVITDISMPIMNGLTMVEKLRGELGRNQLNVIVFTNENNPELKRKFRELNVKVLIVKPFNGPSALPTIRRLTY